MARDELGGYLLIVGYSVGLVVLVKVLGMRRAAWLFGGIVVAAMWIALGTLRAVVGGGARRA